MLRMLTHLTTNEEVDMEDCLAALEKDVLRAMEAEEAAKKLVKISTIVDPKTVSVAWKRQHLNDTTTQKVVRDYSTPVVTSWRRPTDQAITQQPSQQNEYRPPGANQRTERPPFASGANQRTERPPYVPGGDQRTERPPQNDFQSSTGKGSWRKPLQTEQYTKDEYVPVGQTTTVPQTVLQTVPQTEQNTVASKRAALRQIPK